MEVSEDAKAQHLAEELVKRCNNDTTLLDKVLSALAMQVRRISIQNILKGN